MHLFVDNLTNVDFSYLHETRGLVGETWLASVELEGELDSQGMVCDFGIVKKMLRHWLDEQLDHRLLVPTRSGALRTMKNESGSLEISWGKDKHTAITSVSPEQAIAQVDAETISPESVARWCIEQLSPKFPASVKSLSLRFDTEVIDGPFYHYSHGLKKHDGNCQRIAHGHRSRIEIWKDGAPSNAEMTNWANRWQDIYIGTQEDIVETSNQDQIAFRYTSEQGKFYLELPKQQCYIIDTDSTVELIANHIATTLKAYAPESTFTVKAYEGIGKGALVRV